MESKNKKNWLLWVLLIFLPPLGIIYMWITKKEFSLQRKQKLSIIFAIWFIFCMIFGRNADQIQNTSVNSPTEETQQNKDTASDETPDNTPAETEDMPQEPSEDTTDPGDETPIKDTASDETPDNTPAETEDMPQEPSEDTTDPGDETPIPESTEEQIESAIKKAIKPEDLETFNYVPDNNFTLIKFKGSENLTDNMTITGMHMDILNILKEIQPIIDTDVDFNITYPMQDIYGNVKDEIVIKATYTNETIQKINFDNIPYNNIPILADEWWNHDAVNLIE